jgi:hypothetical protein
LIWWVTSPARALNERALLADLQDRTEWLGAVTWQLEQLQIVAEFTIQVGETEVACRLAYPEFFPDAPPSLTPKEEVRLSGHQWGRGGELCLEYRADNWDPSITGMMMVESAFRLLSGEAPPDAPLVESAHRTTVGQRLRGSSFRFYVDGRSGPALRGLTPGTNYEAAVDEIRNGETWIGCLGRIGSKDEPIFAADKKVPVAHSSYEARIVRLLDDAKLPPALKAESLTAFADAHGLTDWFTGVADKGFGFLLITNGRDHCLVNFYTGTKLTVIESKTVEAPSEAPRLSDAHDSLSDKHVAIVGCGSVGSKIAVSLARSGGAHFLLVDPDLFFAGNVVRNELDLRSVGVSKSSALKQRVLEINPTAEVIASGILLGGQESAESTRHVMSLLGKCDAIIDATADPRVFNLCAAVAKSERKALLWGEVFGGGIGGLVAMSRPEIDPPPLAARNQIASWYANQGVEWDFRATSDYEVSREDEAPMVASDAEVSLIAAHLTRFALDVLTRPGNSIFPQAAYVVGFAPGYIFDVPFEAHPITYEAEGAWGPTVEANAAEDVATLLQQLVPKESNAA